MEKLLNSELMHDIVFHVGESGKIMYGHKLVLTTHNEYFKALVSSQSVASIKGEFKIPDIEPAILMEILRFIYCQTANVTTENFWAIYKTANQYLMASLKDFCLKFLNPDNVTGILVINDESINFPELKNSCLEIICENPLHFFDDENLKNVKKSSFNLICQKLKYSKLLYCSYDDVTSAIDKWQAHQREDNATEDEINSLKQSLNVEIITIYVTIGEYSRIDNMEPIRLTVLKPCTLFGFGLINKLFSGEPKLEKFKIYVCDADTSTEHLAVDYTVHPLNVARAPIQDFYINRIMLTPSHEIRIEYSDNTRYSRAIDLFYNQYFSLVESNVRNVRIFFEYLLIEE